MSRKNEILHSAREYFYKYGFEETTFAQIAKDVGITQPALYAHFRNKMDLLKFVIVDSAEVGREFISSRVPSKAGALDQLLAYASANLDFFHSQKSHAHAIRALYYFSGSSAELDQLLSQVNAVAIDKIRALIAQVGDQGATPASTAEPIAHAVHSLLVGDCYRVGTTNSKMQLAHVREQNRRAIQALVEGLSHQSRKTTRKSHPKAK